MPDGSQKTVSIDRLKPVPISKVRNAVTNNNTHNSSKTNDEVADVKEGKKVVTRYGRTVKFNPAPDCVYYDA